MCLLDFLFNDAPQFVRKPKQPKRGKQPKAKVTGTHTFVVQKPFCCPAEAIIRNALEAYGVPLTNYSEQIVESKDMAKRMQIERRTQENLKYGPVLFEIYKRKAIEATFTVPAAQAFFAEYLMESTGRLIVVGGKVDKRNRQWGEQRDGIMPVASDAAKGRMYARSKSGIKQPDAAAWIEPTCTKQLEIISKAEQAKKGKKR